MIFHKSTCLWVLYASLVHSVAARRFGSFNRTSAIASSSATSAAVAASTVASVAAANGSNGGSSSSVDTAIGTATDTATGNVANNNGDTSNNGGTSSNGNAAASLTLDANAVQTGSQSDGQAVLAAGQSPSATDNANFINFCAGKTLTNGLQIAGGSCNGIVMGDIPSSGNMISAIITNPQPGSTIPANQDFNVNVQISNLVAGSFTNPQSTYYAAPQALQGGKIVGHTHVTIQSLGNNIATTTPPDPSTFAFFKGINDAGDGNGGLSATVAGGLPAGVYRVCTMTSASNHQPVTMPLAQRGAQDDCTKFTVADGGGSSTGGTSGAATGSGNTSGAASGGGSSNGGTNTVTTAAGGTAATAASSSTGSASGSTTGGRGGRHRFGGKRFFREFHA